MADVARYLGISKATVSLAVNGKPGVNAQTRQRILACIEEMENHNGTAEKEAIPMQAASLRIIKVVIINHKKQVVCDPELDLWSAVLRTFDTEARKRGYLYGLTYLNETEEDVQQIIDECNLDMVAGVILYGTEMSPADYDIVHKIHKPLVIYDYEMQDGSYSSVCIDNARAVEMAVERMKRAGAADICYLSTGKDIYNFAKRREAYIHVMQRHGKLSPENSMIALGNSISEITGKAAAYFRTNKLPDAFLMENYQVSIGVLAAVRKLGILVPGDVKLAGIDEVPEYAMADLKLDQVCIPHVERASMAMSILDKEISGFWNTKIKVFAEPKFLYGTSI